MPVYRLLGKALIVMCVSLLWETMHFTLFGGAENRSIFGTQNDFIFKGLPRAVFMRFTATAISCCRLRFAGGSGAEGSVGHVVSGSKK